MVPRQGAGCTGITGITGGGCLCPCLHIRVQCVCTHVCVHVCSSWDIPHQGRDHPVRQDPTGCPVRDPSGDRRGDPGLGTPPCRGTESHQPWHQPPVGPWSSTTTHPANFGQHHATPGPSPSQGLVSPQGDDPQGESPVRQAHRAGHHHRAEPTQARPRGAHLPSHVSTHWRQFRFLIWGSLSSF